MALKCGIVGLPNVGKSTLFNCLSNAKAQSANFPFCTIEPNIGVVNVPDKRLEKLEELKELQFNGNLPTDFNDVSIIGIMSQNSQPQNNIEEGSSNRFSSSFLMLREVLSRMNLVAYVSPSSLPNCVKNSTTSSSTTATTEPEYLFLLLVFPCLIGPGLL